MIEGLPPGFSARPAQPDDLTSIAELHDQYWRSFDVEPEAILDFLRWVWGLPYVDLQRDTVIVVDEHGVQAYAHLMHDPDEGGPASGHGAVRPASWNRGLGSAVVGWLEATRHSRGAGQLRTGVPVQDRRGHDLLTSRGFTRVRTTWDMAREISVDDPPGPAPPGVGIRAFRPDRDERVLFEVAEAAFQDHWDHHPQSFESFSVEMFEAEDWQPALAFLAELDDEVVGEVVALEFATGGYIASLGVLRHARGGGIATALLGRAFAALATRGSDRVELSVDASSPTGAVRLYEAAGMCVIRESSMFFGPPLG